MSCRTFLVASVALGVGVVCTVFLLGRAGDGIERAAAAVPGEEHSQKLDSEIAKLRAEIEQLNGKAIDQAHVMVSVSYHFNNLWFAAQHGNWPLAEFYLNETRSHLRWAVRVIPIRKDGAGQKIDLRPILESVENAPLKQLEEAIKGKDREKFVAAYKFTLEGCYACHKTSDKAYLRPQIPRQPADPMVIFEPLPEPRAP